MWKVKTQEPYLTTEKQRQTSKDYYWTRKAIELSLEKLALELKAKETVNHYKYMEKCREEVQRQIRGGLPQSKL